jgi:NADPH2:quinone reductase
LGSSYRYFRWHKPDLVVRSMAELGAFYKQSHLRPIITHRLPLEQGVEALRLLTERRAMGKVVVDVAAEEGQQQ